MKKWQLYSHDPRNVIVKCDGTNVSIETTHATALRISLNGTRIFELHVPGSTTAAPIKILHGTAMKQICIGATDNSGYRTLKITSGS